MQTLFQNLTRREIFKLKSDALYKFQSKIWRVVKNVFQKSDALENFNANCDKFRNFFSGSWFLSCFSGFDGMMLTSVNVNTNLFWRREVKDNVCYRFGYGCTTESCHKSIHRSMCEEKRYDKTLWSKKSGRSAVFLKINLCENKRKRTLARILFFFFNFLCEQQEERSKETDSYTGTARYWLRDITYHSLDIYQNWRCLIKNRTSGYV